jgi:peptidoglycan hydrolase-like protein with peptidoglycan-binding domain
MAIPETISEGSKGPVVEWAQYLLVRVILSYPDIDGDFGPKTKNAVEQYQGIKSLTVDGIVGPQTWAAMDGGEGEPPVLRQGSTGDVVRSLQQLLNEGRGDFAPSTNPVLAVDGNYGPITASAVKGTQQEAGIAADGVVWLQTWALPVHADGQTIGDLCGVRGPGAF